MGKMKEQFMLLREQDTRHDDDAYHYDQWRSRERENAEKEYSIFVVESLTEMFKKMGGSYEK